MSRETDRNRALEDAWEHYTTKHALPLGPLPRRDFEYGFLHGWGACEMRLLGGEPWWRRLIRTLRAAR